MALVLVMLIASCQVIFAPISSDLPQRITFDIVSAKEPIHENCGMSGLKHKTEYLS